MHAQFSLSSHTHALPIYTCLTFCRCSSSLFVANDGSCCPPPVVVVVLESEDLLVEPSHLQRFMVLCYTFRRGKSLVHDRRLTIKDPTPGNALLLAIAVAAAVAAAVCYRPRGVGSRALWRRVVPRSASCTNRGRERTRGARGVQAGLEVVRRRQGRPLPRRPLGRAALRRQTEREKGSITSHFSP